MRNARNKRRIEPRTLLVYVNSQFGVGHYQRCSCILRALEDRYADLRPILLFGGLPYPGFADLRRTRKVQLPGLTFHRVDDGIGFQPRPVDLRRSLEDVCEERRRLIASVVESQKIQLVLVEYFPFSKQCMAPEVEFLLARARQHSTPAVVSSIRDFMTIDDGFNREFTELFISRHCSQVLVHSDPRVARLQRSYGDASAFEDKLNYTGYIVDSRYSVTGPSQRRRIIAVSMGGGKDGEHLIDLLVDALGKVDQRRLSGYEIHVFPGLFLPATVRQKFEQAVSSYRALRIRICEFAEYFSTVAQCAVSISMCGYNTAMELIANRVPNICFVPRQRTEQLMRAEMLRRCGAASVAGSSQELADMLQRLNPHVQSQRSGDLPFDLQGAGRTADILYALAGGHDARACEAPTKYATRSSHINIPLCAHDRQSVSVR